jgi:hypothetical protein
MPFTISIHKDNETQIFQQTVESINLKAVIDAINLPVKAPKKVRKDAGKPRAPKATV